MGSLRFLSALLLLLVMVPAGALAGLAVDQQTRLDAALARLVEQDYDLAELDVRRALPNAVAWVEREIEARLAFHAASLRSAGPKGAQALDEAWSSARASLGEAAEEVRVVGPSGRQVLPALHEPLDGPVRTDTAAGLLEDLRRRADRLLFGARDPEAALAVFRRAREAVPSAVFRAAVEVEMARLRVQGPAAAVVAAEEVRRLRAEFGDALLARVGRPYVLLLLVAAPGNETVRGSLGSLCSYAEASVPLTAEERRRCERILGLPASVRTTGAVVRAAEIAAGVRLEARFPTTREGWLWRRLLRGLRHERGTQRQGRDAVRAELELLHPTRAHTVPRDLHVFETPGIDGRPLLVRLVHEEATARHEARQARRAWITVGVASLFAVVVVGLLVVRRAVRKERAVARLKDDFVANVSHELRTPLTSVLMHSEMLAERDASPERRRELARVVRAEGGRLASLVDDLLDVSALERGTRRLEPEPVDLAEAARRAAEPFAVAAEREGVELRVEGEETVALADPRAVDRILANLLANAWKHGRPSRTGGAGRIRLRAYDGEHGPCVEVRDDGPGIPAEERESVFERFRRGRGAKGTTGVGLGLSLSRDLARAMGGDLVVLEDAGETAFRASFPRVPEDLP